MAVLSDADRLRIRNGLMRYWSNLQETVAGITKTDLKAAVDAADSWVDSNAASYNSALPATFRNNATTGQKSLLLVGVVLLRFNIELLRRIFGEVD